MKPPIPTKAKGMATEVMRSTGAFMCVNLLMLWKYFCFSKIEACILSIVFLRKRGDRKYYVGSKYKEGDRLRWYSQLRGQKLYQNGMF